MTAEPFILRDAAKKPISELVLCHGAGAPADSPFMSSITAHLLAQSISVTRFELAYMAQRRFGGNKRPPPKMERLQQEWVAHLNNGTFPRKDGLPLLIGGKSMGARLACLVSTDSTLAQRPAGVIGMGYPFHPQNKPDTLRLTPIKALSFQRMPALIIQGSRDAFGNEHEVPSYHLPPEINLAWLDTGDHDFKPLKRSGMSQDELLKIAALRIRHFIDNSLKTMG